MGGINHQPTSNVSRDITVPASAAISHGMIQFLDANTHIEDVIPLEVREFGAAKMKLQLALDSLKASVTQVGIAQHYTHRMVQAIERPDYQPFETVTSRPAQLAEAFVASGMLPDSEATRAAAQTLEAGDYHKSFLSYGEQLDGIIGATQEVIDLLEGYLDSEKADQGYFWIEVENGRLPFRQVYARALTTWLTFIAAWQTTALISTEVHLKAIDGPSLLEA